MFWTIVMAIIFVVYILPILFHIVLALITNEDFWKLVGWSLALLLIAMVLFSLD